MELEDVVAEVQSGVEEPGHGGVQVLDGKADVVEPEPGQVGGIGVGPGLGTVEPEELNLLVGDRSPQLQGYVVGLPVGYPHVAGHLLAGYDDGMRLLEAEEGEERHRAVEVLDRDGHVIESAVPSVAHGCIVRARVDAGGRDPEMGRRGVLRRLGVLPTTGNTGVMERSTDGTPYYRADLALVHHLGFGFHADLCAPGILAILEEVRERDGLVVEVGCGSGLLTRHLVDAGHRVVATDASEAMLDLARGNVPEVGEIRRLTLPGDALPEADAIVSVGHALSYLDDEALLERSLVAMAGALRPGGVLAIDLCDLEWGAARQDQAPKVWRTDDWALMTESRYRRRPVTSAR